MSRKFRKSRVWVIDDRRSNLDKFLADHRQSFDVRPFERPEDVKTALDSGEPPDALLCDIYFYDDESEREKAESAVKEKTEELRELAQRVDAKKAQQGIALIRYIRDRFDGKPHFPIYAYTSKGPYLMEHEGFEELEKLDAKWLFKNKYDAETERDHIQKGIREFDERFGWRNKLRTVVIWTGAGSAFLGALLGVLFSHLAHRWWGW